MTTLFENYMYPLVAPFPSIGCRSMTTADSTLADEIFTKHAYTYIIYECYLIGALLFLCGSVAEGFKVSDL